jgi:MFS family permease
LSSPDVVPSSPILDYFSSFKRFGWNARMYLFASMFVAMSIAIQNVIYNLYLISLGYDAGVVGKVATAVALGVALAGIPAGIFFDRVGGKATFSLAVAGMTLSMLLRAFSITQPMILLWAVVNGAANAIYFVSIFPFLTGQSTQSERPHLFGSNMAVWTAFTMLGSISGGFLPDIWKNILLRLDEVLSLRYSLVLAALLALVALLPLGLSRLTTPVPARNPTRSQIQTPASRSAILAGAIVLVLTGLVIGLTSPFMNVYFKQVFHSQTNAIGVVISLSQMMGLFSAFLAPLVIRKFGLILAPVFLMLINMPIILSIGLPIPFIGVVIAFLFSVGLERMADLPLMNLIMVAVHPSDRGAMSGIRLIANYGAQALAGILGGVIIQSAGYFWLFAGAAAVEVLAGILIWALFSRRETFAEKVLNP